MLLDASPTTSSCVSIGYKNLESCGVTWVPFLWKEFQPNRFLWELSLSQVVRYVVLLWAIPTPQTIWGIRLDLELPHLVSNCESRRVSFQGLESKLRRKNNENRRSNWRFSFSLSNHKDPPNSVNNWHILSTQSNLIVTHVFFFLCVLNYKPCQISIKYGCLIEKSDHLRPTYLIGFDDVSVWHLRIQQSLHTRLKARKVWVSILILTSCTRST